MKLIRAVDGLNRLACWLMAGLMLGMTLCTLWQVSVRFLLTGWAGTWPRRGAKRYRAT